MQTKLNIEIIEGFALLFPQFRTYVNLFKFVICSKPVISWNFKEAKIYIWTEMQIFILNSCL